MSNWLWGAALLPFILCGAICIGGMVAAAVGLSRAGRHEDRHDQPDLPNSEHQYQ